MKNGVPKQTYKQRATHIPRYLLRRCGSESCADSTHMVNVHHRKVSHMTCTIGPTTEVGHADGMFGSVMPLECVMQLQTSDALPKGARCSCEGGRRQAVPS